uniref:Uncharacterized protein n=2 Tax=Oryza sativa subsp. japonica TaxID=39947 RepID=Q2R9P9_ORYSJ|nr:hypothetical protein [Oryza sativa Japonica Group]AAX96195.1 hypothetical protein LOC_Os11g08000 [Oryza sativa Japonica Group]ABA91804.1 hypothetical protein LOC_Os11g08000 [Oryza sativa Japonica Group]
MGSKDGLSDNKLLDDFAVGTSNPTGVCLPTRSEPSSSTTWSIEIIQASSFAAYQKDVRPYDVERVRNKEQLSTRVGYGRVHSIIENILNKCGVIAPNLPTKIDDLSHRTGHGWTTREKCLSHYFHFKWSSYDYCLVLDQRCSDFSYYLYFNKFDIRYTRSPSVLPRDPSPQKTPSVATYPTVPLRRLDKASEEPKGTSAGDTQSR